MADADKPERKEDGQPMRASRVLLVLRIAWLAFQVIWFWLHNQ